MDFAFTTGNNNELAKLNQYLGKNVYVEGFAPSQNDVKIYALVPRNVSVATYPHVVRWANNIASFSERARARWSKGKVTLDNEEKKAAPQEKKASKKSSDKPEKKEAKSNQGSKNNSKKDSDKGSDKGSKKDKKNKKDKKKNKQKEEEVVEEPAVIEEEPAAEEAAAEEAPAAEEEAPAAEEAAAEEEPADEDNLSLDDLMDANDDEDDEETKAMFAKQKDLVKSIQERQAANAGKAKSNLTLDVKPFDTETDMAALEKKIRLLEFDGMKWLGGQLVDVAYGIKKLRIMCQIVDASGLSPDTIREEIEKFEDEVQSTDVFAFQMA